MWSVFSSSIFNRTELVGARVPQTGYWSLFKSGRIERWAEVKFRQTAAQWGIMQSAHSFELERCVCRHRGLRPKNAGSSCLEVEPVSTFAAWQCNMSFKQSYTECATDYCVNIDKIIVLFFIIAQRKNDRLHDNSPVTLNPFYPRYNKFTCSDLLSYKVSESSIAH